MKIDLSQAFTTQDVANLLASKDDSDHRQIRVNTEGVAYLSDQVGKQNLDGVVMRFETFMAGNGYVGEAAAADTKWVARIERALRANWPNPTMSYLDVF